MFIVIYFGDKLTALAPGYELFIGLAVGIVVAFPFAAINALPSSVASDIIQKDSIENKVNREGIFAAGFSLLSLIFFILYDEKSVTRYLKEHAKKEES